MNSDDSTLLAQRFYATMCYVAPELDASSGVAADLWPPWERAPEKMRRILIAAFEAMLRDAEASTVYQVPKVRPERKLLSTSVYLRPEQTEALRALAAVTKVPAMKFIREGIDLMLAKEGMK